MSNLLEEYRRRHRIPSVWPVNEGMLFFDFKKKPGLIAITSSFSKSVHACPACPENTEAIVLEIFRSYRFPHCVQRVIHTHMPPDADLLQYVRNHVPKGDKFDPYISPGERNQERWLWEFFLQSNPLSSKAHEQMAKLPCERPDLLWLEQAIWMMNRQPEQFRTFYQNVYSICMVNRRYILMA